MPFGGRKTSPAIHQGVDYMFIFFGFTEPTLGTLKIEYAEAGAIGGV